VSARILITGGAGFIGTHLAKHLVDGGYTVCLVDSFIRGVRDKDLELLLSKEQATLSTIDLLDREAVLSLGSDFEVIFHLAAIVGVTHVMERPYETLVDGTERRLLLG
jgi:nucleoside-diphosphate-sugar epimerase